MLIVTWRAGLPVTGPYTFQDDCIPMTVYRIVPAPRRTLVCAGARGGRRACLTYSSLLQPEGAGLVLGLAPAQDHAKSAQEGDQEARRVLII